MKIDEKEWWETVTRVWDRIGKDEKLKMMLAGHVVDLLKIVREELEREK